MGDFRTYARAVKADNRVVYDRILQALEHHRVGQAPSKDTNRGSRAKCPGCRCRWMGASPEDHGARVGGQGCPTDWGAEPPESRGAADFHRPDPTQHPPQH